ncbi:hypothetical protein FKW77_005669 [Venturia effusa]|uniref:CNH domain-containing protein n=1 Tax=Venturia effusa TaxID=50376 RepID=A0A517LDR9_9PEZI|nr:hypothetical protein FKW77_005669 [Venturia effusa]
MLSAFSPKVILELKQRDKSKIESVLAYGDRLLVGLNTGSLRIYRVNEPPDTVANGSENGAEEQLDEAPKPKTRPVDLLREEEKFSRKPIQQLAIIKEANMLVSLSDGYVSIHDLGTYAIQERLERTKGAIAFAVTSNIVKDPTTGIPSIVSRLAVAVKRRVILWSWQDMELSNDVPEITLIASVKSLTWASGIKMVVGMDPGFVMVDVVSQEVKDIIKPGLPGEAVGQAGVRFGAVNSAGMGYMGMGGWVPKPMAARLGEGELLLAKDVNTLFVDTNGKPLVDKRQVPWSLAPEAIGYSYPYMLALQPPSRGTLEVRSPDTLSLLQSISLPNATFLHIPNPYISLAHAGKGFLVASDRCVWRMGALDYESQIDILTTQGRYDEAISLLGMLEDTLLKDKEGRLREIKILKAQGLFDQRKYRDALDLFSEASAPPARVIALYPKSIAVELSSIKDEDVESQPAEEAEDTSAKKSPSASPKIAPQSTPQSTIGRSMFSRLKADTKKVESETASIKSARAAESNDGKTETPDRALEGKDLLFATGELCSFLAQNRQQIKKYIDYDGKLKEPLPPAEEQGKDYQPPFANLILLQEEDKDIDWQAKLLEVAKLTDTTLFRAYMLARPGLAGSLFRLDNFCDPEVVNQKLYESGRYGDLIDFLHGKTLHREALEMLAKFGKGQADEEIAPDLLGPQRTVGYLQQLPPELIDLILEFAEWPIKTDPKLGMQVFLADTENAETLPRHRVVDFLREIDNKLAVEYLEYIIYELNDGTPDFHQRLINFYLDRLKDGNGFETEEERLDWRARLEKLLRTSTQYSGARLFTKLPATEPDFFEARAIVLSKMGNHKQALQIYVFQIEDYEKAEDYCNHQYLASTSTVPGTTPILSPANDAEDAEPSIYHTLLSLYLTPPPPHKPNWAPALDLLSKHGARLPASSTLDLIPPTLPVRDLESYFRGRIRSANSVMNEERIVARLMAVEEVAVRADLLLGKRNKCVKVTEERLCGVCHKRFGGSAIRVYPDGSVTHYGCLRGSGRPGSGGLMKAGGALQRRAWN